MTDDLRPWGYAPGGYVFTCGDCPENQKIIDRPVGDKRSWRCEAHARAARDAEPTSKPAADDLIARLREKAALFRRAVSESDPDAAMFDTAADEIEKLNATLAEIETAMDGGDFDQWPTHTFIGQLRMQSRDNLDPEYARFMAATATHMGILSGQCDAMRESVDRLKTQRDDAYKALRSISEGNLGNLPWQANYETIKTVATAAIPPEHRTISKALRHD